MGALIDFSINTDGLAKLAKIFSHATGGIARGNLKNAEAGAKAAILNAETEAKVALIKAQGENDLANYVLTTENRKMNNFLSIGEKAGSFLSPDEPVSNEPISQDWINRFQSIAEGVSDEDMQNLWARILAGEVKQPNSYSLRTLDTLKNLTKDEAELFAKQCDFVLDDILLRELSYATIEDYSKLADAGLIIFEGLTTTYLLRKGSEFLLTIGENDVIKINNVTEEKQVTFKQYQLTVAGKELVKLIEPDTSKLVDFIGNHFKVNTGFEVTHHKIISWEGTEYSYHISPLRTF